MNELQTIIIWAIPVIFAITLHEVAHGFIALKCGDGSAKMMGRLTINPIKHIDPIGTIAVPIFLYFTTGFVFGWAKPVPVNFNALKRPKLDMSLVAIAGPFANLLMSIIWFVIFYIAQEYKIHILIEMSAIGIQINLIIMVFNLLPIPPLDGSRIISSLLPNKLSYQYNRLEDYGLYILIALLFLGVFEKIVIPVVRFIFKFMISFI